MHILISAVSSARRPSGICRHAANLSLFLSGLTQVSRVTLLLGSWQRSYFQAAFRHPAQKVTIAIADVANQPFSRNRWYYWQLPQLARKYAADLVQLSFPAPIARNRFSCPVVCSLHDLYPHDLPSNFGSLRAVFNRVLLRQCLQQSDAIVCSSDFTLARLHRHMPKLATQKSIRIHQMVGLDTSCMQRPSRPSIRRRRFLLSVAQHRSNKNLGLLLRSIAELRRCSNEYAELGLVIVGSDGPETPALHALVHRLSLYDHVWFAAALSDAELCWLYHNCELLVVPSQIEGFCLPVAEALACGAPVLCSDIPTLREVGGPNCRYFSLAAANPIEILAGALRDAMRGPRFAARAVHRFDGRHIARQYAALYSALISGSPFVAEAPTDFADSEQYAT